MGQVYKIYWTQHALNELQETINYLEVNFSYKEIQKLAQEIDRVLALIQVSPEMFPKSPYRQARSVPVHRYTTIYYRVVANQVQILSFFSNRKNPKSAPN